MGKELPKSWVETELGKISTKPQYGWTSKSSHVGELKYLRTTDLSKGKINWTTVPFCLKIPEDLSKYQIEKNDILISRAGSVGLSYRIEEPPENAVFASYLIRFKPIVVLPRLVELYLKSPLYWNSISSISAGIAVQNINATKLSELKFPLPPLTEQTRITAKLDRIFEQLDTVKASMEKIPVLLKNFRQQVLTQAVTGKLTEAWRSGKELHNKKEIEKLFDSRKKNLTTSKLKKLEKSFYDKTSSIDFQIPTKWLEINLDVLCESFAYGTSKKSEKEGKYPVLRMGNMQNGKLDWTNLKYTSDKKEYEKYKLKKGDVLFNRTNSPELVGKTSIFLQDTEALYAGYLIKINNYDLLNSKYLNYVLNSHYAKRWSWSVKTDGVSQSNINATKLSKFTIPFTKIEEQQEIVTRVESLFSKADAIEKEYQTLKEKIEQLPQAILHKAFKGELVPQLESDGNARDLLEEIEALKAAIGKNGKKQKTSATASL